MKIELKIHGNALSFLSNGNDPEMDECPKRRKLEQNDNGNAQHELHVLRLMSDDDHGQKHDRASSHQRQQKEGQLAGSVLRKPFRRDLIIDGDGEGNG